MCHALIIEDEFLIADYLAELMTTLGVDSIAIAIAARRPSARHAPSGRT